jgi:4-nitrophenyl phosphatase
MLWICDLDGVLWVDKDPIPGSAEAIATLRGRGIRVVFVTNNSAPTRGDLIGKLSSFGVPVNSDDIMSSAQAAASLVAPGSTALACAGAGVVEALLERGVTVLEEGPVDAVVVGWHTDFNFDRLRVAMQAVRAGARLIGTSDDATYPTPTGLVPGGGSLLAAVAYASEVTGVVAGKPNDALVKLIETSLGPVDVVVGDRPSTDGALARRLGAKFGLVHSGVTQPRHSGQEHPAYMEAPDLSHLVARWPQETHIRAFGANSGNGYDSHVGSQVGARSFLHGQGAG